MSLQELSIEDIKAIADEKGIEYSARIGKDKLIARIEGNDLVEEDNEPEVVIAPERVNKRIERPIDNKQDKRRRIVAKAMKRSKVIIYNNDPREREHTTTFSSVRNSYFGDSRVLPIGKEWWVQQMHIDNLKSIEITTFIKDSQGNSIPKRTKKFTVDIIETDEEAAKARLAKQAKS